MITSIEILPEIARDLGLAPTAFRGLSQVVILAGPNGAGKSRYLRAVETTVNRIRSARTQIAGLQQQQARASAQLERARSHHTMLISRFPTRLTSINPKQVEGPVESAAKRLTERERRLSSITAAYEENARVRRLAQFTNVDTEDLDPRHELTTIRSLRYASDHDQIHDAHDLAPSTLRGVVEQVKSDGFQGAHSGMHAYLSSIARVFWNAEHPREKEQPGFDATLADAYEFNRILAVLLSTELRYQTGDVGFTEPILRGRPFHKNELSNGEKVLLSWAITLHKQKGSLENAVVTIDEPENYLHPDACIQALERLKALLGPDGQIWIATHSVPLIAHGGMESVYLVKENQAVFARNKVEEVVESLLGGPKGREKLQLMLSDADEIAANRFLADCLVPPHAIDTPNTDPQRSMFRDLVSTAATGGAPLRVLDYGAGRGRLAGAIGEVDPSGQRVEYFAFDPSHEKEPGDHEACLRQIGALRQPQDPSYYHWDNISNLEAEANRTFDVVVLCNVLHEIPPLEWLTTMNHIDRLLSDRGVLVVMEDLFPGVGEMPHAGGYLVLDVFGLKELFASKEGIRVIAQAREGRLSAVEVPKPALQSASPVSRVKALEHVLRSSKEQADRLRRSSNSRTAEHGRRHAHHMMQIANAVLTLEGLT